jgi:D-methionine transport system ATP-binding protein
MITFEHLSKYFGTGQQRIAAVSGVDLAVKPGKVMGVIGPSGAGKSTLIRCANLLERPDEGRVIVDGLSLTELTPPALGQARKKIGMIFQQFNLLSSRTVFDNIALPLELAGDDPALIAKKIMPLLELTGLTSKAKAYPNQLSGGQKQRVGIARALANQPKVLLSDEATSALDPETTHSILRLLKDINEQLSVTILLITHEMDVVKDICHDMAIMEHGKIIEQGDVIEFFGNPQTELARRFIQKDAKDHLPLAVKARLQADQSSECNPLWHLSFLGATSQEPLIAHLMQQLAITLNILQADIELIRDQTMGTMIAEVAGSKENIQAGFNFLQAKGVHVEVIGYVKHSH